MPIPAETAARDRLGKGHKIEIQPLSSILGRIKQRQALAIARCCDGVVCRVAVLAAACGMAGSAAWAYLAGSLATCSWQRAQRAQPSCHCLLVARAVCRAPKAAVPDVGNFDDILAQARQGAADAGHAAAAAAAQHAAPAAGEEHAAGADGEEAQAEGGSQGEGGSEGGDGDLQILSSDDEEGGEGGGELRLVELPSTIKKKRMPFIPTQVPACACLAVLCVLCAMLPPGCRAPACHCGAMACQTADVAGPPMRHVLLRWGVLQEDTFEDEVLIDDGYDSDEPLVGEEEGEGLVSSDGEGEEDSSAAEDEGGEVEEEEEGSEQAAGGWQAEEADSDEGEWGALAGWRLVCLARRLWQPALRSEHGTPDSLCG